MGIDKLLTESLFVLIPHNAFFTNVFFLFSAVGTFALIWLVLALYVFCMEELRHSEFIFIFIAGLLITNTLVIGLKNTVKRDRPLYTILQNAPELQHSWGLYPSQQPTDYSFPSGHAASSLFAAVMLSSYHKKKRMYFYLLAGIIGYSRIYLGVHYVADVLAGGAIGILTAWLCVYLFRKYSFVSRKKSKFF